MADIPQEVREAPMSDHERFIAAVAYDCGYQAGLAAGKRAGMERAAEELRQIYVDCDAQYLEWSNLPPVDDEARNFAFDISRYALAALKEAGQ